MLYYCGVSGLDHHVSARGCGSVAFVDGVWCRGCKTDSAHQSCVTVDESLWPRHRLRHAVAQSKIAAEYIDRPDHDAERNISLFGWLNYNSSSGEDQAVNDAPEHIVIFIVASEIELKTVKAEPDLTGLKPIFFWVVIHGKVESRGTCGLWGQGTEAKDLSSCETSRRVTGAAFDLLEGRRDLQGSTVVLREVDWWWNR